MNIITNSISRLSSLYPFSRSETILAASVGAGLAAVSGAAIAGITIATGVALKWGIQSLARRYLESLPPTPEETAKIYRKLENLRLHLACQTITVASLEYADLSHLLSECIAINKEKLCPHQKKALRYLRFFINKLPPLWMRLQHCTPLEVAEYQAKVRKAFLEDFSRPLSETPDHFFGFVIVD